MKKLIACLFTAALITSCSTTSPSPKPHHTKYAFQCLQVSLPDSAFQNLTFSVDAAVSTLKNDSMPTVSGLLQEQQANYAAEPAVTQLTQEQVEEILKHSETTIITLPVVYAGLGESATNDQTKTVEMAVDADIVDGKVVYKKEPHKLGKETSVTINQVQGNTISYKIHAMCRELARFENYNTKEGLEVRLPFFKGQEVNTELTQTSGSWLMLGGSVSQIGDEPKIHGMTFIRVIAPEEKL